MDIEKLFIEKQALLRGHFILSSGLHSDTYFQSAKLLQYPDLASQLGKMIADQFKGIHIDVVVAPAMGGILIGFEVARALGVRSLFVERVDNEFKLRRGFEIDKGEKILVIEDVITTGKSTREVLDVVKTISNNVVGVGAIVDRSSENVDFGVPLKTLLKIKVQTFDANNIPTHLKNVEAVKPGSRNHAKLR